ncbi:hypothetical protein J6590_007859 [Homalodisca vitripennis]|nr:hypothetical protein J6590_007859 [Homalodisca vitripennis]
MNIKHERGNWDILWWCWRIDAVTPNRADISAAPLTVVAVLARAQALIIGLTEQISHSSALLSVTLNLVRRPRPWAVADLVISRCQLKSKYDFAIDMRFRVSRLVTIPSSETMTLGSCSSFNLKW